MRSERYIVDHDRDGRVEAVLRIVTDEQGMWGESYADGRWWRDDYALNFVRYPPVTGDFVPQEEAERLIAAGFGAAEPEQGP